MYRLWGDHFLILSAKEQESESSLGFRASAHIGRTAIVVFFIVTFQTSKKLAFHSMCNRSLLICEGIRIGGQ